jgi:beta-glucosidase
VPADFPREFVWGVATSAYQIEGSVDVDGRGSSIWDDFCRREGAIADASSGAKACDHYTRWGEDLEIMKWLGVDAHRFSIAWPRIFPGGRGRPETRGLDHYSRWVDELLEAGITPWVTLYHWDLPSALEERGGWRARDTAKYFVDYAMTVMDRLGDRVGHLMTHNEPWCAAMLGHWQGIHAPGMRDPAAAIRAAHHMLLSHGWAVEALRKEHPECQLGLALNPAPVFPHRETPEDIDAARAEDATRNRIWLDPLYGRGYPEDLIEDLRRAAAWPSQGSPDWLEEGDLRSIAAECDFLGVNYYNPVRVSATEGVDTLPHAARVTDLGWEIEGSGLVTLLERLHRDYAPPSLVISENGAADNQGPGADGEIDDRMRCDYLREHLRATAQARESGVPVDAYFAWTLCDNFEWAEGYTARFGMVWYDREEGERRPKQSARDYRKHIDSARSA